MSANELAAHARVEPEQAGRKYERQLTEEAIETLKTLEGDVRIYNSLAAFEDGREVARTTPEEFGSKLEAASGKLNEIIRRLPENRVKAYLRNALQSYRDGLFWWEKTYRPRVFNVAVMSYSPRTPAEVIGISEQAATYTVVINWREARRWTKKAEDMLRSSGSN